MMGHHASMATAPIQHAPISTSPSGFHHFNGGNFSGHDGFHHFHNRTVIFIDAFGFPFFSPFPFYGYYPYPYPYGYYPYPYGYDGYGYGGSGYGYGYGDRSDVVAAQRRLARAGYYHGPIDGILGPQTRRAIRAYERDHNQSRYGAIDRKLNLTET
jgi:hypothetical protein